MYIYFNILVFLFGLIIGSFLNVVILRLATAERGPVRGKKSEKLGGRSYCPKCKHGLIWLDLIPIFSFLFLRGKCRYCGKKISWQYPVVEISTGLIFLLILNFKFLIFNQFEILNIINLLFLFYIASSLIVIFVYDLKHYLIPDVVLFPAVAVTFLYRLLDFGNWSLFGIWDLEFWISAPLIYYLFASFLAAGFFLIIFMVSRGRWMGFGDVKLAILLGLILGFPNIIVGLFLAFFFGAIIGVTLMLLDKKGLKSELPFAPFLILGTFLAMFWGQEIIVWYRGFFVF